jgi:hypothetical protein
MLVPLLRCLAFFGDLFVFSSFFLSSYFPAKALAPPGPAKDDAPPPPPPPLEAKTPLFPEGPAQAPGPEETATPFPPLPSEKKTALVPPPVPLL